MKVGDRVKVVPFAPGYRQDVDGLTGVVVRRTSGHYANVVWLDKPHVWKSRGRGGVVRRTTSFVLSFPDRRLEATDEGPRYVTRPTWKVLLKDLMQRLHRDEVEVLDRETGEVLAVRRGVRAASQVAEQGNLRDRMAAR
jgi:hypothetical protein